MYNLFEFGIFNEFFTKENLPARVEDGRIRGSENDGHVREEDGAVHGLEGIQPQQRQTH